MNNRNEKFLADRSRRNWEIRNGSRPRLPRIEPDPTKRIEFNLFYVIMAIALGLIVFALLKGMVFAMTLETVK